MFSFSMSILSSIIGMFHREMNFPELVEARIYFPVLLMVQL